MEYATSVGMEVHAELLTKTKMFCSCANEFGGEVNTRVCPVCLGLPGSLPVINRLAVEHVLRTALALNCKIAMRSLFHRKNYFYPDLPKGYQVSQYLDENPIGYHGYIDIPGQDGGTKRICIKRVHLEEDTGKLMHLPSGRSGVDYNRAGVPLMEIVTDFPPDIHTPEDAREYLQQLRSVLLYLGVCDGKMEQGSLRCEPNISIAPIGSDELGTKAELKNLNSFRAVTLGIQHESSRMATVLESGGNLLQETRGWDETKEVSFPMRVKEREHDYRYFTDPDLPPMVFSEAQVESLRAALPELPMAKRTRYMESLGLSAYDAGVLVADKDLAAFFDTATEAGADPKLACNWLNGDFAKLINEDKTEISKTKITPAHIVDLLSILKSGGISGKIAKDVFAKSYADGRLPSEIVAAEGLSQISDSSSLIAAVSEVLAENPDAIAKYREGKTNIKGFLVGQVMKRTQGRANPDMVNELLDKELSE